MQVRAIFFGIKSGPGVYIAIFKNGAQVARFTETNRGIDSFSESIEVVVTGGHGTDSFYAKSNATSVAAITITAVTLKK